jgi:dihydropyrimidinase
MITNITGGKIVTSSGDFYADLWLKDNQILKVGDADLVANRVIDASGKLVMPGGIDPHVHMHLPTPAGFSSDDFRSGSIAALHGGTTALIDFVTPSHGQSLTDALKKRKKEAENSLIDYSFHVSPVEWTETTAAEIEACIKDGITSFKVYMAYKKAVGLEDDALLNVLKTVGALGGMVTVHAEMGDEIERLRDEFATKGCLMPAAHPHTRPNHTEAQAVQKVITMAAKTNCPLYIVHISTAEAMEHIKKAQAKGQKVWAETCPHYLVLNDSVYEGAFEDTAKYVLSPPLRKNTDSSKLWQSIRSGAIQTAGTDHCPFTLAQKREGEHDFRKIPNGAGGVEQRIALLYTYGVLEGKITLSQMVSIMATAPAKIFGLENKGDLLEGYDADILIWDPNIEQTISAANHFQNTDLNIYEGFKTKGAPSHLFVKGQEVISEGKLIAKSKGEFIERYNTNNKS